MTDQERRELGEALVRVTAERNVLARTFAKATEQAAQFKAERDEARDEVVRLGRSLEQALELVAALRAASDRDSVELVRLGRENNALRAEWENAWGELETLRPEVFRLRTIITELGAAEAAEPPEGLQLATPFGQCADETPHGEHEWLDGPLRRQCGGFVGRAGVARPLCYGGPGCASADVAHWALYDHKPAEPPEGIEALRPGDPGFDEWLLEQPGGSE